MDFSLGRGEKEVSEVVSEEEGNLVVGQNEFALIWQRDELCL